MVLLIDLGNTNLYVGAYKDGKLYKSFRKHSNLQLSSDEYEEIFMTFFSNAKLDCSQFESALMSSVVPSLTYTIKEAVENLINKPCKVLEKGLKTGLNIRTDNPSEMGADLVADAVGALNKYGKGTIIADLGTATKLIVVDNKGELIGCTITLGIKTSMKALTNGTAQLMDVNLLAPKKIVGKNSPDSINSGLVYGTAAMIERMSEKIEEELGYKCNLILTGGCSPIVKDLLPNFTYDPSLILDGLYYIYSKNI